MSPTHSRESLVPLLAPAIHDVVGHAIVIRCAHALGLDGESFTTDTALQVLQLIARERGPFGIAGRVAMMKVLLLW